MSMMAVCKPLTATVALKAVCKYEVKSDCISGISGCVCVQVSPCLPAGKKTHTHSAEQRK